MSASVRASPLAFVVAGGGSLGAVQVGMLEALLAVGARPDLVVGASVGAINGVRFAADPTPAGAQPLRNIWADLTRADVFPLSWLSRHRDGCTGWRRGDPQRGANDRRAARERSHSRAVPTCRMRWTVSR